MVSVELSKGFLDIFVQFLGGILTRFVDLSIIKKGKSSYFGETSRALGERVKEHCKSSTQP